jgi:hypothetical protein
MKFINCTPHSIVVRDAAGVDSVFPASGVVPRVETTTTTAGDVAGIPVAVVATGAVIGAPWDAQIVSSDTIWVVSAMVGGHRDVAGRADVVCPDTGPTAVRAAGQIVAVRGFVRYGAF